MITNTHRLFLMLLLSFTFFAPALANEDEGDKPKPSKLFSTNETLQVKMVAPWKEIERKEDFQGAYPGSVTFTDDLGQEVSLELTAERRGVTRQRVCKFPPIKLRFEKPEVKGSTFRGQKSLKMVTHCNKGAVFPQYYLKEMLAYRMFNLITDFSFRVRPLSVTYVDSKNGKETGPLFAFLIEDDGDLAKRNKQKKIDIAKTTPRRLEAEQASNMAMFQFMISNLDWAATSGPKTKECCHNAKLVGQDPETDPIYPVPYDFDSSGLVDAKYAAPPQGLPVQRTTQRMYRGFCMHNSTMPETRARFLEQEQAIYDLVENESLLSGKMKKKAVGFLGDFFEILKDDQKYQKEIIDECRK